MLINQGEEHYTIAQNDEIWLDEDEYRVVYHPENNSLHFLDSDTNLKIFPSVICKNREMAAHKLCDLLTPPSTYSVNLTARE